MTNTQKAIKLVREFKDNGIFFGDVGSIAFKDGENIWITKSGGRKYDEDGFTLVDPSGKPLMDESEKLSGEYPIHSSVLYNTEHDVVIHTHSPLHAAFGNVFPNYCFDAPALEMRKLLGLRKVDDEYTLQTIENSFDKKELADTVTEHLVDDLAVLVANHGLFVAGPNLDKANDYVRGLNHMIHQVIYEAQMRGNNLFGDW